MVRRLSGGGIVKGKMRGAIFLILPSSNNFEICFEIFESGEPNVIF